MLMALNHLGIQFQKLPKIYSRKFLKNIIFKVVLHYFAFFRISLTTQ